MKIQTKTVFPLVAVFVTAIMLSIPSVAFAEDKVTITTASGNLSTPGCEETAEGCYTPSTIAVDVGSIITMTNTDSAGIHTFTAGTVDGFTPTPTGEFDSGILNADQSFEYTADTAGEIPYYCMLHTWMQGVITIQEADVEEVSLNSSSTDTTMEDDDLKKQDEMLIAEDQPVATGLSSDGTLEVHIATGIPTPDEIMPIQVSIYDVATEELQDHINYDVMATQSDKVVLDEKMIHQHSGSGQHDTIPLISEEPVQVKVTLQGIGETAPFHGPTGDVIEFTIIPEFGTITIMILVVAIISIVALSTKSKLSIMQKL